MVVAGRRKSIAFFIALGAGLIVVTLLLYIGWVLLNWRTGILLFLGVLLLAVIISGVVLNTIFLVREIRRNEQHDAFINAVTHELKTPVASIRLYLETLQTRAVDEATSARSSTASCSTIATGCWRPSSRCCAPAASAHASREPNLARIDLGSGRRRVRGPRPRAASHRPRTLDVPARRSGHRPGRSGRSSRRRFEPDRQRGEVFRQRSASERRNRDRRRTIRVRCASRTRARAFPRPN